MGGSGQSSAGDQGKGAKPKDHKPHHALLGFRETGEEGGKKKIPRRARGALHAGTFGPFSSEDSCVLGRVVFAGEGSRHVTVCYPLLISSLRALCKLRMTKDES